MKQLEVEPKVFSFQKLLYFRWLAEAVRTRIGPALPSTDSRASLGVLEITRRAFLKCCSTTAAFLISGVSGFVCTTSRNSFGKPQSRSVGNPAGDWNLFRGDKAVTGHQPLPTNITNPSNTCDVRLISGQVPWSIVLDLNNDGQEELIIPASDSIGAWTLKGDSIWVYLLPGLSYVDTADVDDDGIAEVIVNVDGQNSIILLDALSGTLKYSIVFPEGVKIYYYNIHVGQYWKDDCGKQMAIATNGPLFGTAAGAELNTYLYRFDHTTKTADCIWTRTIDESTANNIRFITWAASIAGDVDNDGEVELVTFVNDGFVIQNMQTGAVKRSHSDSIVGNGRNYGTFVITDVDNDGKNELILLSDLVSLHLETFRLSNDSTARLWGRTYDGPWPIGSTFIHIAGASPLADINGDGKKELVVSEWTVDQGWALRVYDATTGSLIGSVTNLYVLWMGDLDGDGVSEMIVTRGDRLLPDAFGLTQIYSFRNNTPTLLYELNDSRLEGRIGYPLSEPVRYPPSVRGRSQDARQPFLIDWDEDGYPELLLRTSHDQRGIGDKWAIVGYDGRKYVVKQILNTNRKMDERVVAVVPSTATTQPMLVVSSPGGRIDTMTRLGRKVGTVEVSQSYDYRYLIADVDGDGTNEIVVEDAEGVKVVENRGAGDKFRVRWTTPGKLLACADLVGQNGKAILVSKSSAEGPVAISAFKGNGVALWETVIPQLGISPLIERPVHSIVIGRFSGRIGDDVYVSGGLTVPTGNGNADRSWMLRGDTGQIVWYNDASDRRLPLPSLGPTRLADALPIDMNGDGIDDIAMVSQIWFLALDGPTGQLLFKPVELMHALQNGTGATYQWSGYCALTAEDLEQDGQRYLIVHNSTGAWGVLKLQALGEYPVQGVWKEIPELGPVRSYAAICDVDDVDGPDIIVADGTVKIFDALSGKIRYEVAEIRDAQFVSTVKKLESKKGEIVVVGGKYIHLLDLTEGSPKLVFTYTAAAPLKTPIVGDVDGDGFSEIVVATITGTLLVIGERRRPIRSLPTGNDAAAGLRAATQPLYSLPASVP